jgi:hypothetical protein
LVVLLLPNAVRREFSASCLMMHQELLRSEGILGMPTT